MRRGRQQTSFHYSKGPSSRFGWLRLLQRFDMPEACRDFGRARRDPADRRPGASRAIMVPPMDARTFYDRMSGAYDLLADSSEARCRDQGLGMLKVTTGERLLEIGCGTGHALSALAAATGSAGRVAGVDISSGMLRMAHRTVEGGAPDRVSLLLNDARSLCFADEVFDAAFMSFTLELFDRADMARVLDEVRRVLCPNGRVAVVAMAIAQISNPMVDIYKWLHRHFPHFVDCHPIDLAAALTMAQFHVTEIQHMSIWGLSVACAVGLKDVK